MIKKILVANRGEIAVRVIRAAKELGIKTVAVFSEGDEESLHVFLADESVRIGPSQVNKSYLNIPMLIAAAEITGADAIHPGYGFLAENPNFAETCIDSGFIFIGPSPDAIKAMGDKSEAKRMMKNAGVPVVPGSDGPLKSLEEALSIAKEIGYPVIVKAVSGGGGRGMRIARDEKELALSYRMASTEAEAAFGDGRIYLEKYIENPRHIEVQVIGDMHGNVIHLGERECSIQRRHQKLIEESPSPIVDKKMREKMGGVAVKGAKAIGYFSAGTMEFIVDRDRNFYFMEMNTRIQVEHPVTEMITGFDLVKEQILVAMEEKLSLKQKDVRFTGHAIEVRVNAENPEKGFVPSAGKIETVHFPGGPGIRIDTHIYQGYKIPPYYDSLLMKLIAHGRDRMEAIERLRRALDELVIEGVDTTAPLHKKVLESEGFIEGDIHTGYLAGLGY
ncbi:acetyl-CoA carboxylase biotin carboxylase subunit [candidate division WOR-3 bacterium]|nr:acetyl-CoA carboxylase biotin carboxylase subunit [candidate division WOR-3 bacterium]